MASRFDGILQSLHHSPMPWRFSQGYWPYKCQLHRQLRFNRQTEGPPNLTTVVLVSDQFLKRVGDGLVAGFVALRKGAPLSPGAYNLLLDKWIHCGSELRSADMIG